MHQRTLWAGVFVLAVLVGACSDDDAATAITVTIGADSITVPSEIEAGVVEVTLEGDVGAESEVDFTRVAEGTTEEQFTEMMIGVVSGGPIPEILEDNAGVVAGPTPASVILEPGSYFVWSEGAGAGEQPSLLVSEATVTGDGDGELPDTDGTFTARDYSFEVDVAAGDTFTFTNEGPNEFHHVVLANFGDLDPAVVEENLPAFVQADEATPPPEAFANVDFENAFLPGSGVFSPGIGGTFSSTLESGNTYAVFCFLQDRTGGPPHAVAYNMYDVFQVP